MSEILVAYATAAGSTAGVAEAVGRVLRDTGVTVDVCPAREVTDVSSYGAVVLGTGVRVGRTYSEAASFLQEHQTALSEMPVAVFVVCMTMKEDTEESCQAVEDYARNMLAATPGIEPVSTGLFAGAMDYAKLPWFLRFIIKRVIKTPEGDFRDWEAVETWSADLPSALLGT